MLSTKSTYKCPVCGNELKISPKQVKDAPTCSKCSIKMVLVKQGVMTK